MPLDYAPTRNFACEVTAQWSPVSSILEDNTWKRSAQKKLEQLSKLPENWNSYGSRPVQAEAIEITANLLSDLVKLKMPEPQIFPVSGGGLQLEWKNLGRELEIEIRCDRRIEFLVVDEEGEMYEGQLPNHNSLYEVSFLTHWFNKEGKTSIDNLSMIYALT